MLPKDRAFGCCDLFVLEQGARTLSFGPQDLTPRQCEAVRAPFLDNLAIIHEHDTIGDRAREPPFAGHDDHGDFRFPEMNMLAEMLAA